jgi:hypothetical protein
LLARAHGSEGRGQPRRADDRRQDHVDVVALNHFHDAIRAGVNLNTELADFGTARVIRAVAAVGDRDGGGTMTFRLFEKRVSLTVGAQGEGAIAAAEVLDHLQCVAPDRAGRTQNGDAFRQASVTIAARPAN